MTVITLSYPLGGRGPTRFVLKRYHHLSFSFRCHNVNFRLRFKNYTGRNTFALGLTIENDTQCGSSQQFNLPLSAMLFLIISVAECLSKISELEMEVSSKEEANARLQAAHLEEVTVLANDIKGLKVKASKTI